MAHLTESTVEEAALAWLEGIGWRIAHGPGDPDGAGTSCAAVGGMGGGVKLTMIVVDMRPP